MLYRLRPAQESDREFCRSIHHHGLKPYVEELWGWDPLFQDQRFLSKFEPQWIQIIVQADQDVGYLEVREEGEWLKIENLILAPEARGSGLGTTILSDLIRDNRVRKEGLVLNVLRNNPSQRLYVRLGFKLIKEHDGLCTMVLDFSTAP